MNRSLRIVSLLLTMSCVPTYRVDSGTYTCNEYRDADGILITPDPALRLTVDVSTLSGSLNQKSGNTELTLRRLPESEWITDCHTQISHATLESFALSPDPLIIDGQTVASPLLARGCADGPHHIVSKAGQFNGVVFSFQ